MFSSIRRVISEPEGMNRIEFNNNNNNNNNHHDDRDSNERTTPDRSSSSRHHHHRAIVEPDTNNNDDNNNNNNNNSNSNNSMDAMQTLEEHDNFTTTSSLSDASEMSETESNSPLPPPSRDSKTTLNPPPSSMHLPFLHRNSNNNITTTFGGGTLSQASSSASLRNGATNHSQASSNTNNRDWGWFEEIHVMDPHNDDKNAMERRIVKGKRKGLDTSSVSSVGEIIMHQNQHASAMAVTAPTYVLEESLSSQKLWKHTAGQRPPQPFEERAFFEKMWAQNFAKSKVEYQLSVEALSAASPIGLSPFADGVFDNSNELTTYHMATTMNNNGNGHNNNESSEPNHATEVALLSRMNDSNNSSNNNEHHQQQVGGVNHQKTTNNGRDGELCILVRGDNVFGTTVSKSFPSAGAGRGGGVDTVNISIASYRVVECKHRGKFAQYLIIYREGSIRDTLGVWKRYSDFERLARIVTQAHGSDGGCGNVMANMSPLAVTEEVETEHLPNAIMSWRLLKKRQRWFRCLDSGYLSLKVFLMERFLHDILFESSSPQLLRDFVLGEDMEEEEDEMNEEDEEEGEDGIRI